LAIKLTAKILTKKAMNEEDLNQDGEDVSKQNLGSESDDSELDALFKEMDSKDEVSREEFDKYKKSVSKYFADKGRKAKEAAKAIAPVKEIPNQSSSDDVTELFLESRPEAALVQDDLKIVADAKYGGSIIKAWKGENWLHAKASALAEENANRSKISTPTNRIEGEFDLKGIAQMSDEDQALAIRNMSNKEYSKWKEYRNRQGSTSGTIQL
jgi:hypothetical protein